MHFDKIVYKRNFRISVLDQYLYETLEASIFINEGEDAKLAIETAKQLVLECGSKAVQYPEHNHIEESLPPEPAVLPSIQKEKINEEVSLENQIESCTDLKVLESYRLIVKNNEYLQMVYDEQWRQIQRRSTTHN